MCYNPPSMLLRLHVFLITCGILFCFGFGVYEFLLRRSGLDVAVGAGFLAGGVALSLYLRWFRRKGPGV